MSASACGGRLRGPPPLPAAPALSAAADAIPPDLDVVVRLDLAKVRAALGPLALETLGRQLLHSNAEADVDRMLLESLLVADVVYLGYRPDARLLPLDRVLALEGRFEQPRRPPVGFRSAADLGGNVRHWDRSAPARERGDVARVYAARERILAFVSEAELDAVERLLSRRSRSESGPRPPEEGTLSLAARPALLRPFFQGETLRGLLETARRLTAVVDLQSDVVLGEIALEMTQPGDAERLASAASAVLSRLDSDVAKRAQLRAESAHVVCELRLARSDLASLFDCATRAGGVECAW